jgi:uncharacterized membrane-anchored protein
MHRVRVIGTVAAFLAIISTGHAEDQTQKELLRDIESLHWQSGPTIGTIGSQAQIRLDNTLRFLNSKDTDTFVQLNGNPPLKNAWCIAPRSLAWFAVFEFDPTGYVRDDEKIDPDALLKTLKENDVQEIEDRKRLGLPILRLVGWFVPPHYDTETKRLEWGTKLLSDSGDVTVNYSTRILGRTGVMRAILVSDPTSLEKDSKEFRQALRGFEFVQGQRYTEFVSGDKVAEYGLTALIVGGAAAAAAKAGVFKSLFKFIAIGVVAVVGAIAGVFKRIFSQPPYPVRAGRAPLI